MMKQNKRREGSLDLMEKNGGAFLKKLLHYFVVNVLIFVGPALTYRLCSSQVGDIDAQVNHIDIVLNNTAAHWNNFPLW